MKYELVLMVGSWALVVHDCKRIKPSHDTEHLQHHVSVLESSLMVTGWTT